ncbi:MAG: hypothetical protein ACKOXP_09810 [Flavobacteriales bacterium]
MTKTTLLFLLSFLLVNLLKAQDQHKWQVEGIQLNVGGLMSSKIPSASYASYADFIGEIDTTYTHFSAPQQLTNLRLKFIVNGSVHLYNKESHVLQRFGFTLQNKSISSFILTGTPNIDSLTNPELYATISALRLDHTSPVLTLDYAYLKKVPVTNRLNLTAGAGAYLGLSLWNSLRSIATINYWPSSSSSGNSYHGHFLSDFPSSGLYSFSKHTLNTGLYTSFGMEFALENEDSSQKKWFLTYESRFCFDYFDVKNVPSSWFSFQCMQQIGLKYYLNRSSH